MAPKRAVATDEQHRELVKQRRTWGKGFQSKEFTEPRKQTTLRSWLQTPSAVARDPRLGETLADQAYAPSQPIEEARDVDELRRSTKASLQESTVASSQLSEEASSDEELRRAIEASLQDSTVAPSQPSEEVSSDDELRRAIEASLQEANGLADTTLFSDSSRSLLPISDEPALGEGAYSNPYPEKPRSLSQSFNGTGNERTASSSDNGPSSSFESPNTSIDGDKPSEEMSQCDVWLREDNKIVIIEELHGNKEVATTWLDNDTKVVILDGKEYISTEEHTDSDFEDLSNQASAANPVNVQDSQSFLANLRQQVLQDLGQHRWEIEEFLRAEQEPTDEQAFGAQFEDFRVLESQLSGENPAYIVQPAGSPNQAMHLKLHYPTFKTNQLDYGDSFDVSNPCIDLLHKKGLCSENAFWYEKWLRRQRPPKNGPIAAVSWPPDVQDLHIKVSRQCDHMPKKVVVLFGASNKRDFQKEHVVTATNIVLSETEQVPLGVVRDEHENIRYLVVWCPHPEWLFHNWAVRGAMYYDACINIAAALTNTFVDPQYFENRSIRLNARVRSPRPLGWLQTHLHLEAFAQRLYRRSDLSDDVLSFLRNVGVKDETLDDLHDQGQSIVLYAFRALRKYRPEVKRLVKKRMPTTKVQKMVRWHMSFGDEFYGPNQVAIRSLAQEDDAFPEGVTLMRPRMFSETDFTYFFRPSKGDPEGNDALVRSSRTLSSSSKSVNQWAPGTAAPPTSNSYTEIPKISKSSNPLITTAVIRIGQPVPLKCIKCGKAPPLKPVDHRPEYCTITHVRGRYIARAQVCPTPACQEGWKKEKGRSGRRVFMVPQDESIPYVRSDQLFELNY